MMHLGRPSTPVPPSHDRRRHILRKVRFKAKADANTLNVTLFRNRKGEACGWFIGPPSFAGERVTLPYLAEADETRASVAVVRAIEAARASRHAICLIDPDDLWDTVWRP